MTLSNLNLLNERFAVPGHLEFAAIQGGLTAAKISNRLASATVSLHGAHVMAFQPVGQAPVLWMSGLSRFEAGAPLRGGIPVCWPWFGAHPTDKAQPAHGFARLMDWDVVRTGPTESGATFIELALRDSPGSLAMWPHAFALRLRVVVAARLDVELTMINTGDRPMVCSSALHSYFAVSRSEAIRIRGLEDARFINTVPTPPVEGVQSGPIAIDAEVDRVYVGTGSDCVIEDPGLGRRVRIAKRGSLSTVVWNPWVAKSARMPDFGDDEYHGMVCIETANAAADARTIPPGGRHQLATTIGVELT